PQPPDRIRDHGRLRDPAPDRRPGLARLRDDPAADPVRALDLALEADGTSLGHGPAVVDGRGRPVVNVVSADWVVPVEGEPIADGAGAMADDGTIAAVGFASELGEGERHEGCVILPGFVNAHSHIEYAVYAGFGDGLPFVPWIGMHVQRKEALDFDDMVAIATVGAHECLRCG